MKLLNHVSSFLPTAVLLRIYKQTILPIIDYGSIIWQDCGSVLSNRVEKIQNKAMRTILCANRTTCTQEMRNRLGLLTLHSRRRFLRNILVFKIVINMDIPKYLNNYLVLRSSLREKSLRDQTLIDIPRVNTSLGQTMFKVAAARDWNLLPKYIRDIKVLGSFKNNVFKHFLEIDNSTHRCSL